MNVIYLWKINHVEIRERLHNYAFLKNITYIVYIYRSVYKYHLNVTFIIICLCDYYSPKLGYVLWSVIGNK